MEAANQAYQNSQVNQQVNLVHMEEVDYQETGNMSDALYALYNPSDGIIDEVHALRDVVAADLVSMVNEDANYCGIGYQMQSESPAFQQYAFSVVLSDCLSNQTLAHELGHNQGNSHDRDNASLQGATPYAYGFRRCVTDGTGFRTVMSYSCSGGTRVSHFSNPNVSYNGYPTGIDHDQDPAQSADNARSMNLTADTVASFRARDLNVPPAAPVDLQASAESESRIMLTWSDRADNEDGFHIERSPDGQAWTEIGTVVDNITGFLDNGLQAETVYYYRVRAFNGSGYSGYSQVASAATLSPPPFVDYVAVAESTAQGTVQGSYFTTHTADSSFEVITEQLSGGRPARRTSLLDHTWTFNLNPGTAATLFSKAYGGSSEDAFSFRISLDGGTTWQEAFTVLSASPVSVQSFPLPPGASGTVLVRVTDTDRTPGAQNLDRIYVDHLYILVENDPNSAPPLPPSGLQVVSASSDEVRLAWQDASPDESGFLIERSTDGASWETAGTAGADTTVFSDGNVLPSSTYFYRVKSYNESGYSDPSNTVRADTPDGLLLSASSYKIKGNKYVDLSWSGAAGAQVEIYRDGVLVAVTSNDGAYADEVNARGTVLYRVCEPGGACSNAASVEL